MPHSGSKYGDDDDVEDEEDEDEDIAMEDANSSASLTPALSAQTHTAGTSAYTSPQSIQHSPALDPPRTSHRGSYSSLSTLPSPAFGPQKTYNNGHAIVKNEYQSRPQSHHSHNGPSASYPPLSLSASTSPTIMPSNKEQDHEATAALLMLNQDRRSTNGATSTKGGRGMSVKDLLSC